MLSKEDYKDVKGAFGKSKAKAVKSATDDGYDTKTGGYAPKAHASTKKWLVEKARKEGGLHKSKALSKAKGEKKYITAPSGRKFEITEPKSMGHHHIDYKHK